MATEEHKNGNDDPNENKRHAAQDDHFHDDEAHDDEAHDDEYVDVEDDDDECEGEYEDEDDAEAPPKRVVVVGAGPIGLEAALYARYLGMEVTVFERGEVADHVRRWGHVQMFSPFWMNRSSLGIAALLAQDSTYQAPDKDAYLTGMEYADRYLLPLAATDLIVDSIVTRRRVVSIGRELSFKHDRPGPHRADRPFRILLRDETGEEQLVTADVVIDTSGTLSTPNWLGSGGIPAMGETELRDRLTYHLPDIAGKERARFENRRVLVVGNGYSAATAIASLAALHEQGSRTSVLWVTRPQGDANRSTCRIENDPLPVRDALNATMEDLLQRSPEETGIEYRPGLSVARIRWDDHVYQVQFEGEAETCEFDEVLGLVGYHPDETLSSELHVHLCYATQGPIQLAASLMKQTPSDSTPSNCLVQPAMEVDLLVHPEPGYFILGSKSYGRNPSFLIAVGLQQIRQAFTMIAGRYDLDLYRTMEHFVS